MDHRPTFIFSYLLFSIALVAMGRADDAVATAQRANELSGGNATTLWALGNSCGRAGRTVEVRQVLAELTARSRSTYVPASAFAFVHYGLGELDEGLQWLARGIEERDPIVITALRTAPSLDRLRTHPAYAALLQMMNLAP